MSEGFPHADFPKKLARLCCVQTGQAWRRASTAFSDLAGTNKTIKKGDALQTFKLHSKTSVDSNATIDWQARAQIRFVRQAALALLVIVAMTGCASVIVKKIPSGDVGMEGIRFYRPAPYLMVSSAPGDSKESSAKGSSASGDTLQFTVVWMPDLSQEYVIQAKPGLGSVTFNPTLENGWKLTGLSATADSKTAELLTALVGFVPKALTGPGGPGVTALRPGMYRFVFQTDPNKPNYGQLIGVDWEHPVFTIGP
jgi:hypothetical protein